MSAPTSDEIRQMIADAIAQERKQFETKLVEQEHRTSQIFYNLYEHGRSADGDLRRAAWKALIWHLFRPRAATLAIASGGIIGLLLTASGVVLAIRANTLLERQTDRMDYQNMLTEAQRRSAFLASELSAILAKIDAEKEQQQAKQAAEKVTRQGLTPADPIPEEKAESNLFRPSNATIGRIVSLTLTLRPYRPLEILDDKHQPLEDETVELPSTRTSWLVQLSDRIFPLSKEPSRYRFSKQLVSPERGQLLVSLISQRIDFAALSEAGATFDYADLSDSRIESVDLRGVRLNYADFSNAWIIKSNLEGGDLNYSTFKDTWIRDSKLGSTSSSEFDGTRLENSQLSGDYGLAPCIAKNVNAQYKVETVHKLLPLLNCTLTSVFLGPRNDVADKIIELASAVKERDRANFSVCVHKGAGRADRFVLREPNQCSPNGETDLFTYWVPFPRK